MLQGRKTDEKGAASPFELAQTLEAFLADYPQAAVLEDGQVLFDMRQSRYSVSSEHGRCLLHLWSEERNLIRTVAAIDARKTSIRLTTTRLGAPRPKKLELVQDCDRRTPSVREVERQRYTQLLERVMQRTYPLAKAEGFRSAMDLENSFGPSYSRGVLHQGTSSWAVIGVNEAESIATQDGILTFGLLWLDHCRKNSAARRHFEGLKVVLPEKTLAVTKSRMAWLDPALAKWELYSLDSSTELLQQADFQDQGNVEARLTQAFQSASTLERFRNSIEALLGRLSEEDRARVEVLPKSAAETAFLLHGLEFARVRYGYSGATFTREAQVSFGAGVNETPLEEETEALFLHLVSRLFSARKPVGRPLDPLFRLQPEKWLESLLRHRLTELEPNLQGEFLYSQVPAFAAGDRGMLDLLGLDRNGRLAVVELKVDDDLHLPLQGLDYWIRVRWLNRQRRERRGAFELYGYFPGKEISEQDPLLYLVAPVLHIHPANEIVLKYFSPQVEWQQIAISEHWREDLKVIFRKRKA